MINLHPSIVGWPWFHWARAVSMRSIVGVQTAVSFMPLLMKAPRAWVGSPSWAILMSWGMGSWDGWRHLVSETWLRCVGVPIGISMVFWVLNLAPDVRHHFCR